ncbi:MAG: tetratricopeptide repeat protein [Akkermansia sp.]
MKLKQLVQMIVGVLVSGTGCCEQSGVPAPQVVTSSDQLKACTPEDAAEYFRKAEAGDAAAQHVVGLLCMAGLHVRQSSEEAAKWCRKAAEQGYAKAQSNLGVCYGNGLGVEKNKAEALKWLRKAAQQGNEYAQAALR